MNRIADYSGANYPQALQASFESRNDLVVVRGILPPSDIEGILANPESHEEYFARTSLSSLIDYKNRTKLIPIVDERAKTVDGELVRHERENKRIDGELIVSTIINLSAGTIAFGQRIAESTASQDEIEEKFSKWQHVPGKLLLGSYVRKGDGVVIPRGVVYATQGVGEGKALVINSKRK